MPGYHTTNRDTTRCAGTSSRSQRVDTRARRASRPRAMSATISRAAASGIRRVADRPADDEIVGARAHRLPGRQHALLVVARRAGRPDARASRSGSRGPQARGCAAISRGDATTPSMPGALARAARGARPGSTTSRARRRDARSRRPRLVSTVTARIFGRRRRSRRQTRATSARGPLHHLEAARGVHVEEPDAEPRRLDAGARDRVRDVVELEVEEHVRARAGASCARRRARRARRAASRP